MFGSSGSTQFPYLLDDPRVRYEYNDWNAVMASGTGGVAYLNAEDGKLFDGTANKLKGKKFVYGNQGATRLDLVPALAWDMLGMDVKHVMGVKGRGGGRKMFESGEATIDYQTSAAYLKNSAPLVEQGKAVVMMTWVHWGIMEISLETLHSQTFQRLKRSAIKLMGVRHQVLDGKHGRPSSQQVSLCKKPLSYQQVRLTT